MFLQQDQRQILPSKLEAVVQYALPQEGSRRVIERYANDGRAGLSSAFDEPVTSESPQEESAPAPRPQEGLERSTSTERPITVIPANTPRHPSLTPGPGVGAGPSNRDSSYSPIIPSSAGPYAPIPPAILNIPVSSKPRAYAQQPTYASAPIPVNPIYMPSPPPPPPPQEEVCVECAMRDQDMADVDVTGPGVWERESDAAYEELCRREIDEGTSEMMSNESHRSRRPRAKGGRLTEPHIKLWLTMNPKEPQARQQTLQAYLKEQRGYLDAETIAHARAMQESKQLDTRMRDTYSQLRRSAYELSSGTSPDETGAMRIMAPRSPPGTAGTGAQMAAHPREVTLLENGMIVEHVDVRKEEREERERRRRDDKRERSRARKSSRGSMYSVRSLAAPATDNGLAPRPVLTRPTSSMTTYERPTVPRAYSQASLSDMHSLGSGSPRQRFFGFKNLSAGFRSRDSLAPSGMSGSMVDMHVALQREAYDQKHAPIDLASKAPSLRHSQAWPSTEPTPQTQLQEVPKKKKKGFAKIWGIVTGSKDKAASQSREMTATPSFDRTEDDLPLAPPPPLSYLVERGPRDHNAAARQSTVSLASITSPTNVAPLAISPATSPSSALPSPTSSRTPNMEPEIAGEGRRLNWGTEDSERMDTGNDASNKLALPRVLHPVTSEPDIRRAQLEPLRSPASYMQLNTPQQYRPNSRPSSVFLLDKSLPPLPGEPMPPLEARPHTMYTYDPRQIPAGASPPIENLAAPRAPFRDVDARRQSFGGTTARPNFVSSQTSPSNGYYPREARPPASRYEEFGISRRSLANMENMQEKRPVSSPTPTKRKSRFGLSSLLGRKSQMYETDAPSGTLTSEFSPRRSASDPRDEVGSNGGYTTSASRHSVGPRMSVMSRKAIEELVEQDPQFVAYRYPSNDQRLDLLR
ncbi:hypothetical protein FIBSPDRAFT_719711 [Athelia psychrophila]|uniref:Uncharacterized protein n=1 Tax=Athelia psychrophila TaxID=1759441 RepID=A0A166X880_9AGAM|nr:hypothetical protein FIBSPDRAFT_719711 [Fibularhizoctonia sp. CBS 109695]